jgi:hypothetical protein
MTQARQETEPLGDEEVQRRILAIVALARTIDVSSLIERAERGQLAVAPDGWTAESMRLLATGVARLRRMIAVADENRAQRLGRKEKKP